MTEEGKLSVVEADKGGAILNVNPELLRKKTLEKLENPNLYNKLAEDPTHNLHHELFTKWVEGKEKSLIHPETAKSIMCVSDNDSTRDDKDKTNAKSTSSHHKPGKAYFYPSIKIHKLTKQELVPGVEPPVRLVTALHEGIAKRSDVFLASEYFKDLEKDYCKYLLKGFFSSTKRKFNQWICAINEALKNYGLLIDESEWKDVGEFVAFLNIKYCFDCDGNLQTDLYVKETDSRSYLHFSSAHPNHIYCGIVYSQCTRLRRIINSQDRLKVRLDELCEAFKAAAYPSKMVENISKKVLNSERSLERRQHPEEPQDAILPIRVVSTFGSDTDIVATVKKYEDDLKRTRSFSSLTTSTESHPSDREPNQNKQLFQFVKKTGSNLKSRLVKVKNLALGNKHGQTKPCKQKSYFTNYSSLLLSF